MDPFTKFKGALRKSLERVKGKTDPAIELMQAVEAAGDWKSLEEKLTVVRTINRKRQQEILERLEPLASRVEELLKQAKKERISVKKQNLLRQAEDGMRELEAEDEPAKIYSANSQAITNIITQVRRARAMSERGIETESIDALTVQLEEIVVGYDDAMEAARGMDEIAAPATGMKDTSVAQMEERLSAIIAPVEDDDSGVGDASPDAGVSDLEKKLYSDD